MPRDESVSGAFLLSRAVIVFITRGDGYVTTAQAAEIARVGEGTIRQWKLRGHLEPAGLDERGRPLYDPDAVIRAEKRVRDNGIRSNGTDPRFTRKNGLAAA